jgi:hypothetical protein
MRISGSLALTLLFLAVGMVLLGCSTPSSDAVKAELAKLPKDAANEAGPGYASYADSETKVEVSYMGPHELNTYFSRFRGGKYPNPFPAGSFVIFAVELANSGKSDVTFNPRMTLLVVGKEDPVSAIDYTTFYSELAIVGAEDLDERASAFNAACYDATETVPPGGRVRKLIVYPRSKGMKGSAVIMFNGLYVGHKGRPVIITYPEDVGQ